MPLRNPSVEPLVAALPQKIIIPKGMINPDETTIIEIPPQLQRQPIVIAKRKESLYALPHQGSFVSNGTSTRSFNTTQSSENPFMGSTYGSNMDEAYAVSSGSELEQKEREEREKLEQDLETFQRARRNLIESTSKYSTSSGTSNTTSASSFQKPSWGRLSESKSNFSSCCKKLYTT